MLSVYLNISIIDDFPLPRMPIKLLSSGEKLIVVLSNRPPSKEIDFIYALLISDFSDFILFSLSIKAYFTASKLKSPIFI